jgi:hypothetical protein
MYTHVLDQHGIVYSQPIVLNERQAGVAIEGVIRHNENREDGGPTIKALRCLSAGLILALIATCLVHASALNWSRI